MIVICPTCKKETTLKDNPYRPFCSDKCKLIDLGDWASEKFGIPEHEAEPSKAATPQPDDEE